jgi:antirestriction protein ArdC
MERGHDKGSIYERVTNQIVKAIEAGATEYVMPWHRQSKIGMPRNATTRNQYRGVNALVLWSVAQERGYTIPHWATYQQWEGIGAHVRRGETASPIVFYKPREERSQGKLLDDEEPKYVLRYSSVFNAMQIEGWTPPMPEHVDLPTRIVIADSFVEALGAEIIHGHNNAAYSPKLDTIFMPEMSAFVGTPTSTATESYYAVLFHEHVHWSGSEKRLHRDLTGRFGTSAYAMEELIAELGAAFLCADLGITVEPRADHAAYVANWLQVLREQPTAIFTAAGKATTACQYLMEAIKAKLAGPIPVPA